MANFQISGLGQSSTAVGWNEYPQLIHVTVAWRRAEQLRRERNFVRFLIQPFCHQNKRWEVNRLVMNALCVCLLSHSLCSNLDSPSTPHAHLLPSWVFCCLFTTSASGSFSVESLVHPPSRVVEEHFWDLARLKISLLDLHIELKVWLYGEF
jgi:hypothetical protein